MCVHRTLIVDPCIRCHFDTTPRSSPILGGAHQQFANAAIAERFMNEPAFHESDRVCRIAAVRMRAQSSLDKTSQRAIFFARDKNDHRQCSIHPMTKEVLKFQQMLFHRCFGPEECPHFRHFVAIRSLRLSYSRKRHALYFKQAPQPLHQLIHALTQDFIACLWLAKSIISRCSYPLH